MIVLFYFVYLCTESPNTHDGECSSCPGLTTRMPQGCAKLSVILNEVIYI